MILVGAANCRACRSGSTFASGCVISETGLLTTVSLELTARVYVTYYQLVTGDEVRRLRKRLGLTQAQFAQKVGVAQNSVARWERGEMAIRESAARLMRLLANEPPKRTRR